MDLSIGKAASAAGVGFLPVYQQGLSPIVSPCQMLGSGLNWCSAPCLTKGYK